MPQKGGGNYVAHFVTDTIPLKNNGLGPRELRGGRYPDSVAKAAYPKSQLSCGLVSA